MNPQEIAGALAGGGSYRATSYMLEVTDQNGAVTQTLDMGDIKGVERKGQRVTIKRPKGKDVVIEGATLDDAGRLESALRSPSASGAPVVVVKKGGGIGRLAAIGCGGLIALVAIIAVVSLASGGGDDDSGATSSGNGNQAGANKGDVHVPLAANSSGVIAPDGNDKKQSKVTILRIQDNAQSTNQFQRAADGKKYWLAEIEIEAIGSQETSGISWKLRDSKDIEHDRSFGAGLGESLDAGGLTPGGKRRGVIVFEIDADANPKWLRADPNSFLKNDLYFDAASQ